MYNNIHYEQLYEHEEKEKDPLTPEVISLIKTLNDRKACLKCILGTVICCYFLITISLIAFLVIAKRDSSLCAKIEKKVCPSYSPNSSNAMSVMKNCGAAMKNAMIQKACVSLKTENLLNTWTVIAIVIMIFRVLTVVILYQAISKFKTGRINCLILILILLWMVDAAIRLYDHWNRDVRKEAIKVAIEGVLTIAFCVFAYLYSRNIKELYARKFNVVE